MRKILKLLFRLVVSYIIFYIIFFWCVSVVSTDTVIGLGLIFLFIFIYYFCSNMIKKYLLLQSKYTSLFLWKIIFLLIVMNILVKKLNKSYLIFLLYHFNGLILSVATKSYKNKELYYIKKVYINAINNIFMEKLNFLRRVKIYFFKFKKINLEIIFNFYIINNNIILFLFNNKFIK